MLGSDEVLDAWNQGLVGMCEGERRRLLVPWTMGYGAKGDKGVPPYSDLRVFHASYHTLPRMRSPGVILLGTHHLIVTLIASV